MNLNWKEYKKHVINQFPPMSDVEFNELKESLKKGFDNTMPIITYQGVDDKMAGIIDGANRHRACVELGIIPIFRQFYGTYEEAMAYIFKTNVRRNLLAGQKASIILDTDGIVAKLMEEGATRSKANLVSSTDGLPVGHQGKTAQKLADMAGVGRDSINWTKKVKQHDPALYHHVKEGSISAKSAYNQIQERIAQGDAELGNQRRAKALLKDALQNAIADVKDDFYAEILKRINDGDGNPKVEIKIELV